MVDPDISDFALIGDTRTAALCSSAGSIDWMCVPSFDGEPIFAHDLPAAARNQDELAHACTPLLASIASIP